MSETHSPSLPAFARDVLALYSRELSDVRFPDLDRQRLEASASALHMARESAEAQRQALADAEEAVAHQEAALVAQAQRALAYARIYASGNPKLSAQVDAIAPPGETAEDNVVPRRRARGRKGAAAQELFSPSDDTDRSSEHVADHGAASLAH
jgi:multidrug efflux pump subunit AcrA (membrane-fusion protein)